MFGYVFMGFILSQSLSRSSCSLDFSGGGWPTLLGGAIRTLLESVQRKADGICWNA